MADKSLISNMFLFVQKYRGGLSEMPREVINHIATFVDYWVPTKFVGKSTDKIEFSLQWTTDLHAVGRKDVSVDNGTVIPSALFTLTLLTPKYIGDAHHMYSFMEGLSEKLNSRINLSKSPLRCKIGKKKPHTVSCSYMKFADVKAYSTTMTNFEQAVIDYTTAFLFRQINLNQYKSKSRVLSLISSFFSHSHEGQYGIITQEPSTFPAANWSTVTTNTKVSIPVASLENVVF